MSRVVEPVVVSMGNALMLALLRHVVRIPSASSLFLTLLTANALQDIQELNVHVVSLLTLHYLALHNLNKHSFSNNTLNLLTYYSIFISAE